jgi:hypothetical protein
MLVPASAGRLSYQGVLPMSWQERFQEMPWWLQFFTVALGLVWIAFPLIVWALGWQIGIVLVQIEKNTDAMRKSQAPVCSRPNRLRCLNPIMPIPGSQSAIADVSRARVRPKTAPPKAAQPIPAQLLVFIGLAQQIPTYALLDALDDVFEGWAIEALL